MSSDQTEYELFISYARLDNRPIPATYPHGWVSALKDQIVADHRAFETSPLRIFFETDEIRDMDDWQHRILGALRRSKVLLICLSPSYFQSKPCRWEWDEYEARQHQHLIGSDSHATVYLVEVPGTDEHENAQRLDAIMGKNFTDLRPWFPAGAAAMREEAVRQKMAALGQSVWQRIERARRALTVRGNVRGMTPYFVGRNRELAELHRLAGVGKIGLVTAVHGLGGQGKTELAVAYARGYADSYSLGPWSLAAESQAELLPLIGKLGFVRQFGYAPTEAEKNDAEQLGLGVLLELGRRAEAARVNDPTKAPAALLILDNVSEPGLLAATQLSKLPKVDWLRIIATTRLDPGAIDPARKRLGAVVVDSLDPDNALRLIVDHLPTGQFQNAQDENDARAIVRELGGFTLAVEQVAVFLGLNPDVSPGQYLARLRTDGLPSTDDLVDASAMGQIEHQTKLLRPIIDSMVAPLGEAGRTLLKFAALLPPERIPWPWLKELTARHHPELLAETLPNPWTKLRRQVQGLRLVTGSTEDNAARMHRLVAAHLSADRDEGLDRELRTYLCERADDIYRQQTAPSDWELDGLVEAIPHLLKEHADRQLAVDGMFLSDKIASYRNLVMAKNLLNCTGEVIKTLAEADPTSAEKQRDLSISFNKLGEVSVASGDLKAARGYFEDVLVISRLLAEADPTSAQKQRDLSVSFDRLGDVSVASGDLKAARGYFEDVLVISRLLAEADPTSAQKQRDLSVSFNKLGEVSVASGDLKAARGYFEDGLVISRLLAEADPTSAEKQRDLSVSFNKMADVSVASGDLKAARGYYEDGLDIRRLLAEADPTSAEKQRDLSFSFTKMGDVSMKSGDLNAARGYFEDGLEIRRLLAEADPTSAEKQRDLSISFERLGDVSVESGDLKAARGYYEDGLVISRLLAETDPTSAEKQRDVSISFERMGDVSVASGDLKAARGYFEDGLVISRLLAEADPTSAEKQRDLSVSFNKMGDVSMKSGDLNAARVYFEDGLEIRRLLAEADPTSAQKKRDLWVSHWRLADVDERLGEQAAAATHWQLAYEILQGMVNRGLHMSHEDRNDLEQMRLKLSV